MEPRLQSDSSTLTSIGPRFQRLRRRITSVPSSAWRSFHPSFPSLSALGAKTDTTTLLQRTFARPFPSIILAIFCLGTDTLLTLTRKRYVMSVATKATSLTTTGQNGLMIQLNRLCLTAQRRLLGVTVSSAAQTRQLMASRLTLLR